MQEIFEKIREEGGENIVQGYLKYKAHVCDESYESVEGWEPARRREYKISSYKHRDLMVSRPQYLSTHPENVIGRS